VMMVGKTQWAVAGFNLALLGLVANVAFVTKTVIWTFARFANLFLFAGRFTFAGSDGRWMRLPPYLWLTAFCAVAALCSLISGYFVQIALLKVLSFWVATTGFFAAISTIRKAQLDTTEWFVSQALAVCGLAALSLVLGVGANFKQYADQAGYYNLAFYHSQTMGPGAAFLITYCGCVFLFARHQNRWVCLPIIGFLLYCLILTGSRTGAGTLLLAAATAFLAAMTWRRSRTRRLRLNVSRTGLIIAILLAGVAFAGFDLAAGGRLTRRLAGFAGKKAGEVESLSVDDAIASRKGVAESSWNNFLRSPVTGIGFQVSYDEKFVRGATLFTAPIEKGFLPTALLEEVGVVGTLVFIGFIVSMFAWLYRERNVSGLTMFVALLASNLGEASFFSVAGHGGFGWMMLLAAIVLGDRCIMPAALRGPPVPQRLGS
jgi:hypothetical protein